MENTKIELRIAIPRNDQEETVKKEAFEVLQHFKKCAEEGVDEPTKGRICRIRTKQGAERHEVDKCYNEDAIRIAVDHIKKAGYFVWFYRDYKGQGNFSITTRENCPHTYYSLLK